MTTPTPARMHSAGIRWGLKRKLIVSMLMVGVLPLILGLTMAFFQGVERDPGGRAAKASKALATEAARKLDLLVAEEVARTSRIASDPMVIKALEQQRDVVQHRSDQENASALDRQQARWTDQDPALVKAITENPLAILLRNTIRGRTAHRHNSFRKWCGLQPSCCSSPTSGESRGCLIESAGVFAWRDSVVEGIV